MGTSKRKVLNRTNVLGSGAQQRERREQRGNDLFSRLTGEVCGIYVLKLSRTERMQI